jgi:catechol 2,3-dioxygenase-like lactoylglutathione lyase family enzyme
MSSQPTLPIGARDLVQVALFTRDCDKARAFYRDALQLPLLFEAAGMMFFQLKGLRLMIGQAPSEERRIGGAVLYFDAPDIAEAGRELEARGVVFPREAEIVQRSDTQELRLREFFDPDGNVLALMGWSPRAG